MFGRWADFYIYIYVCVCVCFLELANKASHQNEKKKQNKIENKIQMIDFGVVIQSEAVGIKNDGWWCDHSSKNFKNQNSISINNDQITNPHNCVICFTSNTWLDLISSLLFYLKNQFRLKRDGEKKSIFPIVTKTTNEKKKKYL